MVTGINRNHDEMISLYYFENGKKVRYDLHVKNRQDAQVILGFDLAMESKAEVRYMGCYFLLRFILIESFLVLFLGKWSVPISIVISAYGVYNIYKKEKREVDIYNNSKI